MIKKEYKERVLMHRRWLHQHPEIAFEEKETTNYVAHHLAAVGIPCKKVNECGLYGDLVVNPAYPTIAVRAEIDALPVAEETNLPFSSLNEGKMHACGHDANTAILLTLAELLSEIQKEQPELLKCNVRFIFEPAEEIGEGARYMILNGALEDPEPKEILLFHFGNETSHQAEIKRRCSTAQIAGLLVTVTGKSSHFSQYDDGIDAMYAASKVVIAAQEINRSYISEHPFVLAFGMMQSGTGGNIVAGHTELKGSLRTFTNEEFEQIYKEFLQKTEEIEEETGARIQVEITKIIPPIINDARMVQKGAEVGTVLYGDGFQLVDHAFLAGDNAAFYLEKIPGMHVVFMAKKENEVNYPIHNSRFDIDEEEIGRALEFLFRYLTEYTYL